MNFFFGEQHNISSFTSLGPSRGKYKQSKKAIRKKIKENKEKGKNILRTVRLKSCDENFVLNNILEPKTMDDYFS